MAADMHNVLIVEELAHIQAQQAQDDQIIVTILKRRKQWEEKKEEAMLGPALDKRGEKNPSKTPIIGTLSS